MIDHLRHILWALRGRLEIDRGKRSRCPVMRCLRAFTLIELLVVIAIVGLLISILLPVLGRARLVARQTREMSGAKQLMTAYTAYANDSKDRVLVGFATPAMVNGRMVVLNDQGDRLTGEVAQRYPWRLAPYLNYDFRGLYQDDKQLKQIRDEREQYVAAGVNYDYVVSLFPSLGLNATFVGGNDRVQGFDPVFQRVFGRIHVERLDESRRPSELLVFVSARAEQQPLAPQLGRPEGFFRVDAPRFLASQATQWESAYNASATNPGNNSGFVSLRHMGKAVTAHFDTHCGVLGWQDLNDMRRWADQATYEDWGLAPR